jgi:hypothetical protein
VSAPAGLPMQLLAFARRENVHWRRILNSPEHGFGTEQRISRERVVA